MTETPNTVDLIAETIQHGIHQGNNAYQIAQDVLDKLGSVVTPGDPADEAGGPLDVAATLEASARYNRPSMDEGGKPRRGWRHQAAAFVSGARWASTVAAVGPTDSPAEPNQNKAKSGQDFVFSDEQVERAGRAIWTLEESGELDVPTTSSRREMLLYYQHLARAALKAAAVTPQPGCCKDDTNVLDASMTQVDEAALAEVVAKALGTIDTYPGLAGQHAANGLIIARAVAAWLKGGGR